MVLAWPMVKDEKLSGLPAESSVRAKDDGEGASALSST